ncbi:Antitoxin component YwqK of the YwqJK toxin-antitoxin module [Lishizhenia tianjinensis]|uniref:Antitoxin component YwqK of the YwqJK toxin-antitoxin module n=1 Tax=Lishizhenia tianjinensis TaxID=477690 RepID=A0A1I6XE95_9FLAO|nr:toxin-antitoxin system YwqK family antitoxin [Lishizhenia tianjinensis]SFT36322.1 Antitoxin component YwqK of the YwqJK toxin-antitoxin module [Lishizhenia tianjinensis]
MKKIIVFLFFLSQVFIGFNQTLTLKDLQYVCSQSDWTKVNNYLTDKGWEYYESEKGSSDRYNTITWTFNRGYGGKASGWFHLYTFDGLSNKVLYSVFNQTSYNKVHNQINSLGYKLNESVIEDNEIISTYKNSRYFLELTTEKRESSSSYYDDGGVTAYNFELILKSGVYDPDNGKKYEYYWDGKTLKLEYVMKDGELHGPFKSYNYNGTLKKTGVFKNGEQHGFFVEYRGDGSKESEYNVKDGVLNGSIKSYYENSKLEKEGFMLNGKEHGNFKEYTEEGVLELVYNKKNGEFDGSFKVYYENGQLKRIGAFANGVESGEFKEYNEEGKLEYHYFKKNGVNEGKFYEYEDGKLILESNYKNDQLHGEYVNYFYNDEGEIGYKLTGDYLYDKKNGLWKGEIKEGEEFRLLESKTYYQGELNGPCMIPSNDTLVFCSYDMGSLQGDYMMYFDLSASLFNTVIRTDSSKLVLLKKGKYQLGKKHGMWSYYFNSGSLMEKGPYNKGKKHGNWSYYHHGMSIPVENGELMNLPGQLRLKEQYNNGLLNGVVERFSYMKKIPCQGGGDCYEIEDAYLKEHYLNGTLHGDVIYKDSVGTVIEKGEYYYGKKQGVWLESALLNKEYGYVFSEGEYQSDLKTGNWVTYGKDKVVLMEINYVKDEFDGVTRLNNLNGDNLQELEFENDNLVSIKVYDELSGLMTHSYKINNFSNKTVIQTIYRDGLKVSQQEYRFTGDGNPFEFHKDFVNGLNNIGKYYIQEIGLYVLYDTKERLTVKGELSLGTKIGDWYYYDYEQDIYVIKTYKYNKVTLEKYFYINSSEAFTGDYFIKESKEADLIKVKVKNGLREGNTKFYDKEGKVIKKDKYKTGLKIS